MHALRTDLRAISADGAAASVMVGIGETYLPAFVLALSANQLASGLVSTVPLVLGAVAQLAAPYGIKRLGSYRRWVVLCAAVQALSFLPLLVAALTGAMSTWLVFAVVAVYWGSGLAGGPAWNQWVSTLVPQRVRARYMARRTRLAQASLLAGFVVGGVSLQLGSRAGYPLVVFALLFLIALASRVVSAGCLRVQREPLPPSEEQAPHDSISPTHAAASGRRLVRYLVAVQGAVQISAPYFTPYMLCHLDLGYADYVILIATAYLAKVVCLAGLGRVAQRWGAHRLLWIGAVAIAPVSALWVATDHFGCLVFVQIFSGVAWAAYELATLLLFFDAIPAQERVAVLTHYNLAYALATLAGSVCGGLLLAVFLQCREAYLLLFAISAVARLAAIPLLMRVPRPAQFPARPSAAPVSHPVWILRARIGSRIARPHLHQVCADAAASADPASKLPADTREFITAG